ncbi:MAG: ferritin family protein [Proteobacteria bacterium]|nr:ferritin family protein [Pseudomonadota bacterium]MBU1583078.1 ferritin family protein [Pseudomonadota bacterium]MBU2454243.1 ferritin family protein [Pseudomonadota bacterium]MBU2630726.1 ferritin family protein [Pseudomonadota bacterium]
MDAQLYKKVIKDAIAGEIEAKEFYLKISERIKDSYLQELFEGFSKEEEAHAKILSALLDKGKIKLSIFSGTQDYKISETIDMPEVSENMDLKNAIGLAMKNEELAMQKYQKLARDCDDLELKSIFNNLAAMEKDHKYKMEQSFVNVAYPEVW